MVTTDPQNKREVMDLLPSARGLPRLRRYRLPKSRLRTNSNQPLKRESGLRADEV